MNKIFDVEVVCDVDPERLNWPQPGDARDETGLGCNREYMDFRGRTWREAINVLDIEKALVQKFIEAESEDTQALIEEIQDADEPMTILEEILDRDLGDIYMPFDFGVNSIVFALSAARCVPFTSCNGGCFGEQHHESYPVVAFFMKPAWTIPLMEAAEEAGIGLRNGAGGSVNAYSDDIRGMFRFAQALISRKAVINSLKLQQGNAGNKAKAAGSEALDSLSLYAFFDEFGDGSA